MLVVGFIDHIHRSTLFPQLRGLRSIFKIGKFNQAAAAKRPAFYDDDSVSWKDTKLGFTVARVPVHQRHAAGLPVDCFDGDLRLDDYRWRIAAYSGPRRVWTGPGVKVVGSEKAECGAKLYGGETGREPGGDRVCKEVKI